MNADRLARTILPVRPNVLFRFSVVVDRIGRFVGAVQAWRAERAERRLRRQSEEMLAELSPHTLRDIGAPESLINRRRRQDEFDAEQRALESRLRS
jgi:uncharacterized protein YjiS (DUF1127 family)